LFCLVTAHLSAQKNAIKMLHSRVAILLDYLVSVKKGLKKQKIFF